VSAKTKKSYHKDTYKIEKKKTSKKEKKRLENRCQTPKRIIVNKSNISCFQPMIKLNLNFFFIKYAYFPYQPLSLEVCNCNLEPSNMYFLFFFTL